LHVGHDILVVPYGRVTHSEVAVWELNLNLNTPNTKLVLPIPDPHNMFPLERS